MADTDNGMYTEDDAPNMKSSEPGIGFSEQQYTDNMFDKSGFGTDDLAPLSEDCTQTIREMLINFQLTQDDTSYSIITQNEIASSLELSPSTVTLWIETFEPLLLERGLMYYDETKTPKRKIIRRDCIKFFDNVKYIKKIYHLRPNSIFSNAMAILNEDKRMFLDIRNKEAQEQYQRGIRTATLALQKSMEFLQQRFEQAISEQFSAQDKLIGQQLEEIRKAINIGSYEEKIRNKEAELEESQIKLEKAKESNERQIGINEQLHKTLVQREEEITQMSQERTQWERDRFSYEKELQALKQQLEEQQSNSEQELQALKQQLEEQQNNNNILVQKIGEAETKKRRGFFSFFQK